MKIFERGEQANMSGRSAKMGAEIIPGLLESIRKAPSQLVLFRRFAQSQR